MRGYNVDVGVVPVNEKSDRKQLEVDFVCNLGLGKCYIQSAYSIPDESKYRQESRPLINIGDSFRKMMITRDIVPAQYDEHGILTMNVYDFLTDRRSVEG